ncbi:uncharacterized protein ACBR49_008116 [Aulostomus maculatus]
MSSLQHVNPMVRGIRLSPHAAPQSLAARITRETTLGAQKPFQEVIDVSSGDPQGAGLKPLSFARQVLAACLYPQLLKDQVFPPDVGMRAQSLLEACDGGSVGSYTDSSGLLHVRKSIAEFITRRDAGVPSHTRDIFIAAGSQKALMVVLHLMSSGEGETGVLTPMPCPHTLPMVLDEVGGNLVPYQLIEERGWAVDPEELQGALEAARGRCEPRAIYISNPGNPTGHVQDRKSIEEVIKFAAAQRLLLLVDEVYQDSVFGPGREFLSYKKVLFEMGEEFSDNVELISFHSLSSACMGECGLRAGYMEIVNMDPQLMLFVDTMLCTEISTPVTGQLALDLMVNPPKPGDPSYATYAQEVLLRRATLSQNAQRAQEFLNGLPGVSCQSAPGGVYLYPQLQLPAEALRQAEMAAVEVDVLYCQRLLEEEGVLVGAGSLHGGPGGGHHLRFCVLVPPDILDKALARLGSFHHRCLTPDPCDQGREVNPRVRRIRAPTPLQSQAARATQQLAQGEKKPFKRLIDVSSGDPKRAGTAPITFVRQVLAACLYPDLLQDGSFPLDVKLRTQRLLGDCDGGSVGSYNLQSGLLGVKQSIAEFITRRDGGVRSHPESIIISTGSQKALMLILHLMSSGEGEPRTGVLTPMPCPHTLPMVLDEAGMTLVPYKLIEERGWAVDLEELQGELEAARGRCEPRAIYVSNPGNPTGHVQDRKTMEEVIRFAATERLIVLAEEVYQDSVFGSGREFLSYKKVLFEMGEEFSDNVELISFHSLSSACMAECGLRAGYMEVINMDPAVNSFLRHSSTCTPILAQLALEVMVNPPKPGDASYQTYTQEIHLMKTALALNAQRACEFLNDVPGMSCQPAMGGMFLYPRLHLPRVVMEEAKVSGLEADVLYCQRLLDQEGVCLGAGCENGQDARSYHIRLCVLLPPDTLEEVLARLRSFHLRLLGRSP